MKTLYILSALGVIALLAEIFKFKKLLLPIVLVGLLCAIGVAVKDWNTNIHYYNNMLTFDNYGLLFTILICAVSFLWFLMSQDFFSEEFSKTDHYALSLFAIFGASIMVSYSNMVMLFIGIEILSIPLYVLAGSKKDSLASNESALKYFLMGAFATGFLLFGIALVYGATGTFDLNTIARSLERIPGSSQGKNFIEGSGILLTSGTLMLLVGLSFKVSAAPFHFWAPDVYQGAPTPITAFMSTIVKTAAFAAFLRLFITCFFETGAVWMNIIWVLAALTILIGNITAVYQTNVKRMLAYSSISHAGYMLLAILSMNQYSAGSIFYYAAAYSVSTIGAFAVLSIVERTAADGSTIDSYTGLSKRNPFLAFAMTVAMLSLSGIPPLAGFFGKYYIFFSALQSGHIWLVLIAILGSLIGVYYYFRIIIKMYQTFAVPVLEEKSTLEISGNIKIVLFITILLSLLLGIFPDLMIGLI